MSTRAVKEEFMHEDPNCVNYTNSNLDGLQHSYLYSKRIASILIVACENEALILGLQSIEESVRDYLKN